MRPWATQENQDTQDKQEKNIVCFYQNNCDLPIKLLRNFKESQRIERRHVQWLMPNLSEMLNNASIALSSSQVFFSSFSLQIRKKPQTITLTNCQNAVPGHKMFN